MLITLVGRGLLIAILGSLTVFSNCNKKPLVTNLVVVEYRLLGHFTTYNPEKNGVPPPPLVSQRYSIYEIVGVSNTDQNPNAQFNFTLQKVHLGPQGKGKDIVLDPQTDFASQDNVHPPMPNGMKAYFRSPKSDPLFVPPGQKLTPGWKILVLQTDTDSSDNLFYESVKPESVLMNRLQSSEPPEQDKKLGTLTEQNMPGRPQTMVNVKYRHLRTFTNYENNSGGLPPPSWPNTYNVYELISIEAEPQVGSAIFSLSKVHSFTRMTKADPGTDNPVVSPLSFNPPWTPKMKAHFIGPTDSGSSVPMASMALNWKIIVLCQQCAPAGVPQDLAVEKTHLLFYSATGAENVIMTRVPEQEPKTKYSNDGFLHDFNLP